MQLGCYLLMLQYPLLFHFHISVRPIRIDPVQIRAPPVRNRTIPVLQSLENGNRASFFWNYEIPDPDQIGSGDGCSSSWSIETGFTWNGTAETIRDNQHIYLSCLLYVGQFLFLMYHSIMARLWVLLTWL